jgi:hypothetical protein
MSWRNESSASASSMDSSTVVKARLSSSVGSSAYSNSSSSISSEGSRGWAEGALLGVEGVLELPEVGRKGGMSEMTPGSRLEAKPLGVSPSISAEEEDGLLALAGGRLDGVAGGPEGALFLPFLGGIVDIGGF